MTLIARAELIATILHRDQRRKPADQDYIEHPRRLAAKATELDLPAYAVAAMWLHDTIEDCFVDRDQLFRWLGGSLQAVTATALVVELTNKALPSDGNRATRMLINRNHLATISPIGKSLKCLDIWDNLTSAFDDAVWAEKYFGEKDAELRVLTGGHDQRCHKLAYHAWFAGPHVVPKVPGPTHPPLI